MQPTSFQRIREEKKREVVVPGNFKSDEMKATLKDFVGEGGEKKKKAVFEVDPPFQLDDRFLGPVRDLNTLTEEEKVEAQYRIGGRLKKKEDKQEKNDDEAGDVNENKKMMRRGQKPLAYEPPWQLDGNQAQGPVVGKTRAHIVGGVLRETESANDDEEKSSGDGDAISSKPKKKTRERQLRGGLKGSARGVYAAKSECAPPWQLDEYVQAPVEGMPEPHRRAQGGKGTAQGVYSAKLDYNPPWQAELADEVRGPIEGMTDSHKTGGQYADDAEKIERVKHQKTSGGLKGAARGCYGNSNAAGADGKGIAPDAVSKVHYPWMTHEKYPEPGHDPGPNKTGKRSSDLGLTFIGGKEISRDPPCTIASHFLDELEKRDENLDVFEHFKLPAWLDDQRELQAMHPRKKRQPSLVKMVAKPRVFKETLSGGAAKKHSLERAVDQDERRQQQERKSDVRDANAPETNVEAGKPTDDIENNIDGDEFYMAPAGKDVLMKSSGVNGWAPYAPDVELDDGYNLVEKKKHQKAQGGLKGAARGVYQSRLVYNPPWQFDDGTVLKPVPAGEEPQLIGGKTVSEDDIDSYILVKKKENVVAQKKSVSLLSEDQTTAASDTHQNKENLREEDECRSQKKLQYNPPWQLDDVTLCPISGPVEKLTIGGVIESNPSVHLVPKLSPEEKQKRREKQQTESADKNGHNFGAKQVSIWGTHEEAEATLEARRKAKLQAVENGEKFGVYATLSGEELKAPFVLDEDIPALRQEKLRGKEEVGPSKPPPVLATTAARAGSKAPSRPQTKVPWAEQEHRKSAPVLRTRESSKGTKCEYNAHQQRRRVRVLFDYNPRAPDELMLRRGEILVLVRKDNEFPIRGTRCQGNNEIGWWEGFHEDERLRPGGVFGRKKRIDSETNPGKFPHNFVEEIPALSQIQVPEGRGSSPKAVQQFEADSTEDENQNGNAKLLAFDATPWGTERDLTSESQHRNVKSAVCREPPPFSRGSTLDRVRCNASSNPMFARSQVGKKTAFW